MESGQSLEEEHRKHLAELLSGKIVDGHSIKTASTLRGVYILWLRGSPPTCLKVGIATLRRKKGLKGRIQVHMRSSLGNSVLARHLQADRRLANRFNLALDKRRDRQVFLKTYCDFQILPLPEFTEAELRVFERFLEQKSGLNPLYCGKILERN
jgi:hypothetical protein